MSMEELESFVSNGDELGINFGKKDDAPSEEWVRRAEEALGCEFPRSYRWFLFTYGGGEIHGDEIFSVYQVPFDSVVGGDVVSRTLSDRNCGFVKSCDVSVCSTDFGEIFVLDTASYNKDGECPVVVITGGERNLYADNFGDFIKKFAEN